MAQPQSGEEGRELPPGPPRRGSGGTEGAAVLCVAGAFLIILQSLYFVAFGNFYSTSTWGLLGLSVQELGGFGVLEGALLAVLALTLYLVPERHLVLGVGMMTLALVSLYSGGGVILGALLCYVASLIAIFAHPPPTPRGVRFVLTPEDEEDPVVEADLIDSGYGPQPSTHSD